MKKYLQVLLMAAMLLSTACVTGAKTYNAKTYTDNGPGQPWVPFENDKGIAVEDDGVLTPYAYEGTNPDEWYVYNFKTGVIDENEAKQLNWLAAGIVLDPVTSQLKKGQGCIEANVLTKSVPPAAQLGIGAIQYGLFYFPAKGSTIYQATKNHDARYIGAGAKFKLGLSLKNMLVKC